MWKTLSGENYLLVFFVFLTFKKDRFDSIFIEGYSLDRMNMTEIGEHDWKVDNMVNLTLSD